MDLEGQGRIRQVVEQSGTDDVVAVLGANSAAAVEMTAMTLRSGDPSYAGPLAGVALGIPSYHVLEPEIVGQIDAALYERELALPALAMDLEQVIAPMRSIRNGDVPSSA
jgi:glycine/sarcosine/betaine reductase complex component A